MTNVYAWPPVGAVGTEWTTVQPISVSRSMITGARYVSQFQRERRMARIDVSSLGKGPTGIGRMGAGYMEVLKRLLAGGVHLVRLYSYPINWYLDAAAERATRQGYPVDWDTGTDPALLWGGPLYWFNGSILNGMAATVDGWNIVSVTGLPASTLVARPGEFLTVFESLSDEVGTTVQIVAPAYSNASGMADIRVMSAIPYNGRVNIGGSDTAVFEAITMPRAVQGIASDWTYSWEFKEVFSDEVPGGFTEINPWS